jgi:hypothetical protein
VVGAPIFCSGRNFARSSYLAPSVVRHRATTLRLLPASYSTTATKSIRIEEHGSDNKFT